MTAHNLPESLTRWQPYGWITEPETLGILRSAGLDVVEHCHAATIGEAEQFAREQGFPLAVKVVSPEIMHKTEVGGVVTGISSMHELARSFERFSAMPGFTGMMVAEMLSGVELILGAKIDRQFGPVILLGIGGTGVEIYGDAAIRMAPLTERDVAAMAAGLRGHALLHGFRGRPPVSMDRLTAAVLDFSALVMEYREHIESIDINPLFCSDKHCTVADARIILRSRNNPAPEE